LAFIINTSLDS